MQTAILSTRGFFTSMNSLLAVRFYSGDQSELRTTKQQRFTYLEDSCAAACISAITVKHIFMPLMHSQYASSVLALWWAKR